MLKTSLYVVTHVQSGILQEVWIFLDKTQAEQKEKELWKEHDIPIDEKEREKYYDEDVVDDDMSLHEFDLADIFSQVPKETQIKILTALMNKYTETRKSKLP